jgi:hypothetical protein
MGYKVKPDEGKNYQETALQNHLEFPETHAVFFIYVTHSAFPRSKQKGWGQKQKGVPFKKTMPIVGDIE